MTEEQYKDLWDAIAKLYIQGILSDSEKDKARYRLVKIWKEENKD